eukprot:GHUV01030120.1.p1 GENE.GHUV01030120.1~~GHUV01030120.1.p1  ORF type:complete len:155 (+),score=50.46 GHUV01030120.1:153-617(+)
MRDLCVCHQQVMKPTQSSHQRLRLGDSNLLVAVDTNTQRLLKYQELDGPIAAAAGMSSSTAGQQQQHSHHHHHRRGKGAQHWKLDASFWSERDCVQVRLWVLGGWGGGMLVVHHIPVSCQSTRQGAVVQLCVSSLHAYLLQVWAVYMGVELLLC